MNIKDGLTKYKCLCYNKNYRKIFDENLKKWFVNTYTLLLWKGVYSCKYMDDLEKFNETLLPEKEDF